MSEKTYTHDELVDIAVNWLRNSIGCGVVLSELVCAGSPETPDAWGYRDGSSILVECKTSRADFMKDKKKEFRKYPERGMGNYRVMLCPEGVIKPEDLIKTYEGWGLLWVLENGKVERVKFPQGNMLFRGDILSYFEDLNVKSERSMMASMLRRIQKAGSYDELITNQKNEIKDLKAAMRTLMDTSAAEISRLDALLAKQGICGATGKPLSFKQTEVQDA